LFTGSRRFFWSGNILAKSSLTETKIRVVGNISEFYFSQLCPGWAFSGENLLLIGKNAADLSGYSG
jgi:hypothetical protein